ncbi:hypothetical protein PT974_05994 [Cladobotryum mycophilum]|uniref:Fork-head domain-containing protein n=1 Tax=Cladobotryum mycophilum TaxID=491253 RepID=A0ABR0SLF2_9HYPO
MDSPYSDGGPSVSSYTNLTYPETRQQSSPMPLFVKTESFPILSPSDFDEQQHLPDTSFCTQTACHLSQQRRAATYNSDVGAHMTPQSSHQPRPQQVWPSPPLGPGDIQNCIPFQDPPTSASLHLPCYTHSPSPTSWSSPTPSFLQPHGVFQQQQQQQQQHPTVGSPAYLHICTPTSSKEFSFGDSDISTPYTGSFFQESESETACLRSPPMMAASLPTVPTSCSSAGSPDGLCAASPASGGATNEAYAGEQHEQDLVKSFTLSTLADLDTTDNAKPDEPYAKLIYRAFMSQPGHAMTLQDIYQWFRDNTDKAGEEKGAGKIASVTTSA